MRPWEYVNQKIGTIGTDNNQDQDNVNANTEKNGNDINLKAWPISDDGVASKIEDASQNKNKNDLNMPNNTKETINGQK